VSKGGRGLTDDEKTLWRRVAARLKTRRPIAEAAEAPPAARAKTSAVRLETAPTSAPAPTKPRPPPRPQDRGAEKRVRRGRVEIGGTLDLHGHNQDTGRATLARFLGAAHARGARTVVVITGVGRSGRGVLKRRLPEWLAEHDLRPLVSGFAQAHRAHGGEGAYYVFLRRSDAT
jgi:DNA-nicking Smr family endonuclease